MAHFAVTDVAAGRFRFAQKLSRAALGLAGAQGAPLKVWIDDWSLTGGQGGQPWALRAAQPGYELEVELTALTPPVLNGDAGLSVKSQDPGSASYYYSIPRLAVHGRLLRDGAVIPVHGLAWLDREWGSGAIGASEAGWDWFALQLSDGSALMFYQLRDRDGTRDPHSAGTFIAAGGATQPLGQRQVDIEVLDRWTDAQGVRYPSAWRVRVPDLSLDLTVRPVLADQELKTQPRYWEGAVDVSGTGARGPTRGRGYVELVGYARNGE
jgi:predicted secreted hydrolase